MDKSILQSITKQQWKKCQIYHYPTHNGFSSEMIDISNIYCYLSGWACWAYIIFEQEHLTTTYRNITDITKARYEIKKMWLRGSIKDRHRIILDIIKRDCTRINEDYFGNDYTLYFDSLEHVRVEESLYNDLKEFIDTLE